MKVWIVQFRYGSRVFARVFTEEKRAKLRAFRIRERLHVVAEIIPSVLDGPDEVPDTDYPRPNGAT